MLLTATLVHAAAEKQLLSLINISCTNDVHNYYYRHHGLLLSFIHVWNECRECW